ncbi:MAG: VanZ family protein [Burkholderiales bacterium]
MTFPARTPASDIGFARLATLAYACVVVIASLYPFRAWRLPDRAQLWTQLSEWPRYYTYGDVGLNIAAYVPLGFLVALGLRPSLGRMRSATAAIVATTLLSSALEILQSGIASRVPSGLDVFCNAAGGWIGAWGALAAGAATLRGGTVGRWRRARLEPGVAGDAALVLGVLWLLAQFRPDVWLFVTGDLRGWLPARPVTYSAFLNIALEAIVATAGLTTIAGIVRSCLNTRSLIVFLLLTITALVVRAAATSHLMSAGDPLLWTTPGNAVGIAAGLILGGLVQRMSARDAIIVALVSLVAGMVVLNGAPWNPYFEARLVSDWHQGHLRSLAGTTRIVATIWPFLGIAYLASRLRHEAKST